MLMRVFLDYSFFIFIHKYFYLYNESFTYLAATYQTCLAKLTVTWPSTYILKPITRLYLEYVHLPSTGSSMGVAGGHANYLQEL